MHLTNYWYSHFLFFINSNRRKICSKTSRPDLKENGQNDSANGVMQRRRREKCKEVEKEANDLCQGELNVMGSERNTHLSKLFLENLSMTAWQVVNTKEKYKQRSYTTGKTFTEENRSCYNITSEDCMLDSTNSVFF